jgi:hypothetical protein
MRSSRSGSKRLSEMKSHKTKWKAARWPNGPMQGSGGASSLVRRKFCRGMRAAQEESVISTAGRSHHKKKRERRGRCVLVTDLVPSEMACLESSPGRISRTAVWISRDEIVLFLLYLASAEASDAIRYQKGDVTRRDAKEAREEETGRDTSNGRDLAYLASCRRVGNA